MGRRWAVTVTAALVLSTIVGVGGANGATTPALVERGQPAVLVLLADVLVVPLDLGVEHAGRAPGGWSGLSGSLM